MDACRMLLKLALWRQPGRGCAGIAFPSIATGVRGFPAEAAARIPFRMLLSFLNDGTNAGRFDLVEWIIRYRSSAEIYPKISEALIGQTQKI